MKVVYFLVCVVIAMFVQAATGLPWLVAAAVGVLAVPVVLIAGALVASVFSSRREAGETGDPTTAPAPETSGHSNEGSPPSDRERPHA